jgi:pimeloyl-ACP methyl ester carboxylesterase
MTTLWTGLLGAETRFYDARGIRTRSIQAGSGETVLFLHGTGATAEAFARNVVPLATRYDARAIDILGHGLTGTIDGPLSKEAFIGHVIDYMDEAGIERAHVIGNSLGGWIAIWLALMHPSRVRKIVNIVGPHFAVPISEETRAQTQAAADRLKKLSKDLADDPTPQHMRARLGWLFHNVERDLTDELVDVRWTLYKRSTNGKQVSNFVGNPGAGNILTPERLAKLEHSTLLVWTDHNPAPAAVAESVVGCLPDGELIVMKNCGHWPQWEDAATFNRMVMTFLQAPARAAAAPGQMTSPTL